MSMLSESRMTLHELIVCPKVERDQVIYMSASQLIIFNQTRLPNQPQDGIKK